jgi:hypothetical protein
VVYDFHHLSGDLPSVQALAPGFGNVRRVTKAFLPRFKFVRERLEMGIGVVFIGESA